MQRTIVTILIASLAIAQQSNQTGVQQTGVKFQANTQLVVVNVAVKDKDGGPLEGLKASDFTVTEDGKPEVIKVFEYQRMDDAALPAPVLDAHPAAAAREMKSPVSTPIAPAHQGEVKYKDRRLLVLFFDQAGMAVSEQLRAQKAALKFLNSQMTKSDLVAVMTYVTDLNVLQDFTDDRDRLIQVVRGLSAGETGMGNGATGADSEGDTGAAYTQDDSEFNIFNTDRKLAALESAVKMLGSLSEKKALVYFASGMQLNGIDNQAQLRATVNAAIRGNVAFYPVDARGLVASAPIGDATQASQGGQAMYSGSSQRTAQSNFQGQQETLYTLASDTGGKALLDQNDLTVGIVQAQHGIASYYILGYYSNNTALDGRYRQDRLSHRVLRLQGVQALRLFRPGTAASGSSDAGRPRDGSDDRHGNQLFSAGQGPIFRAGKRENTGERYRIGAARRRGQHASGFYRADQGFQRNPPGDGSRRYPSQAQGRKRRSTFQTQSGIRHGIRPPAGHLLAEISGS